MALRPMKGSRSCACSPLQAIFARRQHAVIGLRRQAERSEALLVVIGALSRSWKATSTSFASVRSRATHSYASGNIASPSCRVPIDRAGRDRTFRQWYEGP